MAKDTNPSERRTSSSRFSITPQLVAGVVLVILAVIFIAENGKRASILFIAGSRVNTYLWLALLIAAALGFVGGLLVARRRART